MRRQFREFGDTAKTLSKTPNGIIALFIVLIYAFAALVTTSKSFTSTERLPLIYFLVIFPVLVLGVFAWLVKKGGLILPEHFRDETHFLEMLRLYTFRTQQKEKEIVSDSEDTFMPAKKRKFTTCGYR
jgi:hypothetical protein